MSHTKIIPVIHYADDAQALRNADIAFDAGCEGVMLIEMMGRNRLLPVPARTIKQRWPDKLVGLNFLNASTVGEMPCSTVPGLDMTWTDDQLTHTLRRADMEARILRKMLLTQRPGHLLFCGVAFKYQPPEPDPCAAAAKAVELGFIPTTSGPETGKMADVESLRAMRDAIGPDAPLAVASGITPWNAEAFLPFVTHMLVATGVSTSFHEFDPALLKALVGVAS